MLIGQVVAITQPPPSHNGPSVTWLPSRVRSTGLLTLGQDTFVAINITNLVKEADGRSLQLDGTKS
jgi:hypothetical protein